VIGVGDIDALFFRRDFAIKLIGHAGEFRDHGVQLNNAAPLLLDLKTLQAHKGIPRFHDNHSTHATFMHNKSLTRETALKIKGGSCSLVTATQKLAALTKMATPGRRH
jgi:hypothetical protein